MDNQCQTHSHCSSGLSRFFWGLVVVLAGVSLYAFNTGALPLDYKKVVFSFPMLLTLFGFIKMICGRHKMFFFVLFAVGLYLLAPKLGVLHPQVMQITTPLLIVVFGLFIMFRRRKHKSPFFHQHSWQKMERAKSENCFDNANRIEENRVFSGTKRKFGAQVFQGGEVNCVFGGAHLDLSSATLPEGTTRLEVNCVFGGVSLNVPDSWTVHIEVNSLMGAFQDRRHAIVERDTSRVLVISGSTVFGGGDVRTE